MRKQWQYFLLAMGFFTRIPVPSFHDFQESDLNHASKYFPFIGILVGLIGAIIFYCAYLFLPLAIAVLISMAATIYATGAFHEDGLADSADGLGGGWDKDKIITIMQDSRLGTYGAVALFLMLFAKFQTLNALNYFLIPIALVTAHALSRLCAVWMMQSLDYVKISGKAKPLATKINIPSLLVANLFGLLPFFGVIYVLSVSNYSHLIILKLMGFTLIPVLISWVWWRHKIQRWLGGYTGDCLGATQQITELAFYFGVLAWSIHLGASL
ncbi:MAG: adenosylcobinamide-GDP ribazoletransferase [Methylotenera sp.]|nr:MAG: adenosylcobinamide-GDP ribazoletransferase [Methylotenera sp.]